MGAKGAVEIIFRGKDVAEREKEYTELFCNPMVRAPRRKVSNARQTWIEHEGQRQPWSNSTDQCQGHRAPPCLAYKFPVAARCRRPRFSPV